MSYKTLSYLTDFTGCSQNGSGCLVGNTTIIAPVISGLRFGDPFRIPHNGARVVSPIWQNPLTYGKEGTAYPQISLK